MEIKHLNQEQLDYLKSFFIPLINEWSNKISNNQLKLHSFDIYDHSFDPFFYTFYMTCKFNDNDIYEVRFQFNINSGSKCIEYLNLEDLFKVCEQYKISFNFGEKTKFYQNEIYSKLRDFELSI